MSAIRVVRGAPDDCELAALVAVLGMVSGGGSVAEVPGPSVWGDPAWRGREVRAALGAWRVSGLPH
ncbi:Acyl-CoA carboxylase epsilon subunit [Amycolatopsis pretoriensis]|uniref:Acyl-CoA carboxylase epsilon subunit n=1 Tax=Amycolatopsis pretoriensis TaxID=218821 RepID=A0A1H5R4R9_9PSEU|nr:acyl-CoA carboxylase subunit epsilon [Amycolatopsis pretoriensis]SEF33309.1 Acyl-CoA carboxylase epsilon subunit [Amycolatopsis pretoriensis]